MLVFNFGNYNLKVLKLQLLYINYCKLALLSIRFYLYDNRKALEIILKSVRSVRSVLSVSIP